MKKMKQKVLAVLLCAACAASLAVPAFADGEVQDAPVSETEHAEEAQEAETQAAETKSKEALEAAGSEDEGVAALLCAPDSQAPPAGNAV